MDFEDELIPGVLIKRYKRFFVDIKLKNKIITAHCPNSGSMLNLLKPGNQVWFTKSKNEKRKLKYTLQIIEVNKVKHCVNTHITNKVIQESLNKKLIDELAEFSIVKAEKKFGKNTRFDFYLGNLKNNKKAYLEVKSVSLSRRKGFAEFPDAVTIRGKKHLQDLMLAKEQGYESYLIFLVQIENCNTFSIASDIDPDYFKAFKQAISKKVNILCYDCKFSNKGIRIRKRIKILVNE